MQVGARELQEALALVEQAQKTFISGFGTDNELEIQLEMMRQEWDGDEFLLLKQAQETLESISKKFSKAKEGSKSTWEEKMDKDLWKFVEPIASYIDITKMGNYYASCRYDIIDAEDHTDTEIEGYVAGCIGNPETCGINISFQTIAEKCDMKGYVQYVIRVEEKEYKNSWDEITWVYHLLTNFCDVLLSGDDYDYDYNSYYTDRACEKVKEYFE